MTDSIGEYHSRAMEGKKSFNVKKIDNPEAFRKTIEELRDDLYRFDKNLSLFKKNYPNIAIKHPELFEKYEALRGFSKQFDQQELSGSNLDYRIKIYNNYVDLINKMSEDMEGDLLGIDEVTKKEEQEIKEFSKQLWKELFPESSVSKFVKFGSGNTELGGYQKILMAPGEGIEFTFRGFASLLDPKTYKEFGDAVNMMVQMDKKDIKYTLASLNYTYEQLSVTDRVHYALILICSLIFVFGGYSKVTNLIKNYNGTEKIKKILNSVLVLRTSHHASNLAKMTPALVMNGLQLKHLKL